MRILSLIIGAGFWLLTTLPAYAQETAEDKTGYAPTRYGTALLLGNAYDPDNFGLVIVQGLMLVDYDRIAWHAAPQSLRVKFEANAGITTDGRHRSLVAVNMLAFSTLGQFRSGNWTPFVEAGIGLIYTDFRVEGQGLRINFNPQLGAGLEYSLPAGDALTIGLRLHHLSNGNTYKDNRGINSALMTIGYLF